MSRPLLQLARVLRLVLLAPLLVTACDCANLGLENAAFEAPSVAKLVEWSGPLEVVRANGEREAASAGLELREGDRLVTGPGASAVLRYADGTEVVLAENTRLELTTQQGRLALRIEEGSVISRRPSSGLDGGTRLGLLFLTAYGSSEIVQGSELRLALGPGGEPVIEVVRGEVLLLGLSGEKSTLIAGETLNLRLGRQGPVDAGVGEAAPEPLVLRISAVKGAPRIRTKEASRFTRLSESPQVVGPGTSFELPRGAQALLESDALKIGLEAGSRGTLVGAQTDGEEDRQELLFERGTATLKFPGERKRTLMLTGGKRPLAVRVAEPTEALLTQTRRTQRFEVRLGEVSLELGGKALVVRAGEVASISGSTVEVRPLPAPPLVLAPSRRIRVYTDGLPLVGLAVPENAQGAKMEIADDAAFSEPRLTGRAPQKVAIVEAPSRGQLHWRFLAPEGEVLAQGQANFEPDRGRSILNASAPLAEVTETGLKAAVYFQGAPPALRFSYLAREGAAKYRMRLYAAEDLKNALVEKTVSGTSVTIEAGLVREGNYLWYAAPLDAAGKELSGGRMNKLALEYDNSRRGLAIAKPRQGARVGGGRIETRGVAPIGSKLFVNGRAVDMDEKGRFTYLAPGAATLVYRVVDKGGERYWMRTLRRSR